MSQLAGPCPVCDARMQLALLLQVQQINRKVSDTVCCFVCSYGALPSMLYVMA